MKAHFGAEYTVSLCYRYLRPESEHVCSDGRCISFAYALKTWHKAVCPNDLNVCKKLRDANTEELMPYLLNVTFKGMLSSKLDACWFK